MIPPIANRFVAGETPAEALAHAARLEERGVSAIVNLLGEHYDDPATVAADVAEYERLIEDIADAGLDATVSVKPSQLGLDLGATVFDEHLERLVEYGVERGVFVWVDMEDHTTTDATLAAFERLAREHDGGVGVCLQANLKRTREDLERLADVPGKVRLVKGAYDEPAAVAFTEQATVNRVYRELLAYALETYEGGVAVASHDPALIEYAAELAAEHDADLEFQLLMGVREDAQYDLSSEYPVYQYVPYGSRWKSYFYRRVRERRENLWFALRAIVGR
ncbi:proline dehydrogenase family protein [Natronobiforma cellulositropha]|uniref:proline dehydrogenase family protein n=1 Tax=Natronobiforma cellulositropha TaxID=1679076 RepID=UPI0021D5D0B2|nr:proline dehydrogenase family protein [Natronobiforma cellulositropha]